MTKQQLYCVMAIPAVLFLAIEIKIEMVLHDTKQHLDNINKTIDEMDKDIIVINKSLDHMLDGGSRDAR